jgi:uncharacterized membrane protein
LLAAIKRLAVRLDFEEKPWDLFAAVGYTAVLSTILLLTRAGNLLATFLVLFVPGYLLIAALFPEDAKIKWIERFALSFGLSIPVVALIVLFLNLTPFGIGVAPLVATITLLSLSVGYSAYWRRMRLPPGQRLGASLDVSLPAWREYTTVDKIVAIALAVSIVLVLAALAYVGLKLRPGEAFTEFYILGPGGNASAYPKALNASELAFVILGIVNHESASVNYTVRVDLVGVWMIYNVTSGRNQTAEVNRTTWSTLNVMVNDGQRWTAPYSFQINNTGLWKIQFILFKSTDVASPYRELHLYLRVK